MRHDKTFWEQRWRTNHTGWDIGYASPPLKDYIDQLQEKNIKILIPGSGNGYEAEYTHKRGFKQVWALDYSRIPFENLHGRYPDFPKDQLLNVDFFSHEAHYDLILEQTFFSSFQPQFRNEYAKKCFDLLNPGGKLVGVLFGAPMNTNGPPYGGSADEYRDLFDTYFNIRVLEMAYNSIKPRRGNELFILLEKKNP